MFHFLFLSLSLLTLTGCVQAAMTAGTSTGVAIAQERSVGKAIDDWTIWAQIKHMFLQKDVDELLGNVRVEVVEGRVHLTGTVSKPSDRIEAVRLSWQPDGVREVINDIEVHSPGEEKRGSRFLKAVAQDNWITTQVKTKLLLEKEVRSVNYNIETNEGVVYMMGIGQSQEELDLVTTIISHVKGVQRVVSYVVLKDDKSRKGGE